MQRWGLIVADVLQVEFFQDDIFVPTLDVEHPALSASEWLSGQNKGLALIDLRPDDLKPCASRLTPIAKSDGSLQCRKRLKRKCRTNPSSSLVPR